MAHIGLIGATGFVGAAVLKELTNRGHTVAAIERAEGKTPVSRAVSSVVADVYELDTLTNVLSAAHIDVLVSAFNPGWNNPSIYTDFLRGYRNIVAAVKAAQVPRLLVVGGAGSLFFEGKQLVDDPEFPKEFYDGANAARDFLAELQNERDIDWVFLSPPIEFNQAGPTDRTGAYRIAKDEPVFNNEGHSIISLADLAVAIVDEIETSAHHKERFTVGY